MDRLHLPSTTSTMDVAAQALRDGAPHGTVITADEQTNARGRQGRVWTTFPGHALAATWVMRDTPAQHLALVFALAVVRAIQMSNPDLKPVIKWPNDVYLGGAGSYKKLCGILVETHGVNAAVGVGLNLTRSPAMSDDFAGTSLGHHTATPPTHDELLNNISTCVMALVGLYQKQGWQAVAPDYTPLCVTLGPSAKNGLRVQKADGTVFPATINALNPDGSLDIVTDSGEHITVTDADKLFHDYLS